MSIDKNAELLELIDDIVAKNTFSLEVLDSIKALKNRVAKLDEANSDLNSIVESKEKDIEDLKSRLYALDTSYDALNKLYTDLKEKEKEAEKAIYLAEKEKAVAAAYREAMQIVFKPNVIRETVARGRTYTTDSGIHKIDSSNETKTIDEGM